MSSAEQVIEEPKRSFGIGGAGNIRAPADAKIVETTTVVNPDGTTRRRSSVWSVGTDGSGRRASIVDKLLRRNSKSEQIVVEEK